MAERAGDGLSDRAGVVLAVAVGEDQRGGEVEAFGAGSRGVVQGERAARGVKAEIGSGAGMAATPRRVLHITK